MCLQLDTRACAVCCLWWWCLKQKYETFVLCFKPTFSSLWMLFQCFASHLGKSRDLIPKPFALKYELFEIYALPPLQRLMRTDLRSQKWIIQRSFSSKLLLPFSYSSNLMLSWICLCLLFVILGFILNKNILLISWSKFHLILPLSISALYPSLWVVAKWRATNLHVSVILEFWGLLLKYC